MARSRWMLMSFTNSSYRSIRKGAFLAAQGTADLSANADATSRECHLFR